LHPYSVNDSSTLKASADGSIVITLTPGLTIIFSTATKHQKRAQLSGQMQNSLSGQKNTIPKELDSLNHHRAATCDQKI
jgi:hypothetical protein